MASASQVFGNSRQTQPSTNLSAAVNGSRVGLPRRSTMICCRSTRISASSAARDRNRSTMRASINLRRPDIRRRLARCRESGDLADLIYDRDRDHLVVTMDQGRDLARCLGNRRVALMKRHGCVVTGKNVREAVMTAVYLQVNAKLLLKALQLGTPDYLTPLEVEKRMARLDGQRGLDRAWEYWCVRAGADKI